MAQVDYAHNQSTSPTSNYNSIRFAIEIAMAAKMTCTIVKVTKVTNKGEVKAIGRVSVQPLVKMVDGIGQTEDHASVFNLPYVRMAGGAKAVIIDPKVGDIGIVVIADRDISGVKGSKKVSPPGSARKNNIADGIYISTVLADAPTCYIRFTDDDKIVASPDNGTSTLTLEAGKFTADISGMKVVVKPGRIDLGEEDAPFQVETTGGPSTKVWAIV